MPVATPNGGSGQYVYFPVSEQKTAAYQHYRHLIDGTVGHSNDYVATAEDRAHFDAHKDGTAEQGGSIGARKCVSTPPGGRPANKNEEHA